MRKFLIGLMAALTLTAPVGAWGGTYDETARTWDHCRYEDGPAPCVWDAQHRGNGEGKSFVLRRGHEPRFVRHARAHEMLARG